jgi:hypothetical protein
MRGPSEDPKSLVAQAYRMEGITDRECRSILVDWALSLEMPAEDAAGRLLARAPDPGHPMTALLRAAARGGGRPRRRGGRRGRLGVTDLTEGRGAKGVQGT